MKLLEVFSIFLTLALVNVYSNPLVGKRCVNLGGDSCANGEIAGAGLDDAYLTGGSSPGKRSLPLLALFLQRSGLEDTIGAGVNDDYLHNGNNPGKRCINVGGDSCANGELPGAGLDDDYLNGGASPGKRSFPLLDLFRQRSGLKDAIGAGVDDAYLNNGHNPGKRCINVGGDSCANGELPGAGLDDAYLTGGSNPGKRSFPLFDLFRQRSDLEDAIGAGVNDEYLHSENNPGKRCINVGGDSCANGELPGAGLDDDYLNGGSSPGKRSYHHRFSKYFGRHLSHPSGAYARIIKRMCMNVGSDACANADFLGAGTSDAYLTAAGNPGK